MYTNESVSAFIKRVNKRLDQEVGEGQFWSQAELIEYMNEGIREVWQQARENHQNWFVRQMNSTDGTLMIGGRKYDTSDLRVQEGRERLNLPPDFYELVLMEPVRVEPTTPSEGPLVPAVVFEFYPMTNRVFRQGVIDSITTGVRRYRYDVVFGPDGPYIFVAPMLSVMDTVDIRIAYISVPLKLGATDTFEGTGLTELMTDAILAYTCYAAAAKHDLTEQMATFNQNWLKKQELVGRSSGPKQTRDEETVEGYLEEELLLDH